MATKRASALLSILKGLLAAAAVTLLGMALIAALVLTARLSDGVLTLLNQLLKALAVVLGVRAAVERGGGGESFHEIENNLRTSDPYMGMADFADYRRAQNDLSGLYRDRGVWNRMSLMNIANAGIFSADRAVNDYARDIWHVKPIK